MSARFWWRRSRFWWQLSGAAAGAAAVGLAVAVWVPSSRAGIAGAAVTAVVTGAILGVQARWRRRAEMISSLPAALDISSSAGGFPLVRDMSDAIAVGVHPAAALETPGGVDRVPPYVARDFEPQLGSSLERNGLTLLVGESASGKTRAAFEAMRLMLDDFRFVMPASREALAGLLPSLDTAGNYVVWLDDIERFLGTGGLTLSVLHRLLLPPARTIVLATMRSHEYDRYRDRAEADTAEAERDIWREGRAVLRQAHVIHVNRRWTAQEKTRARAHAADHRFAQALATADRFGIAESLAAGPELAEVWRDAWAPGRHPRGAALVAAAVGARQAGYHRPLPQTVLERMHEAYLAERGGPDLRPESMREAMQWALAPTFPGAANSLLIGSAAGGYLAFDYLIDLPGPSGMPDASWNALAGHATGHDAYMFAISALQEGRYDRFVQGCLRAAQTGSPLAEGELRDFGMPLGPASESLRRARQRMAQLRRELGPEHADTLEAEQCVVVVLMQSSRHAEALTLAQELTARAEDILGPEDRLVLALRWNIGCCKYTLGHDDGLRTIDSAVEEASRVLGPSDSATVLRSIGVVRMLTEAGQTDSARERLTALEASYPDLPSWHVFRLQVQQAEDQLAARQPPTGG